MSGMRNETRVHFGLCLVIVTILSGTGHAFGQKRSIVRRTIVGYVKNREGRPVANARVCAMGTRPISGAVPCGKSDLKGRFAFVVWVLDKYTISAEQIPAGYPNPRFGLYG